jgi:hypothetical protein
MKKNRPIDMAQLTVAFLQYFSSAGITTGYGLDCRGNGFRFPAEARDISLLHSVQTGSGAHPASHPMGTGVPSSWIKLPGREDDHSPSSSAEVKNNGLYLHFPIRIHGVVLI